MSIAWRPTANLKTLRLRADLVTTTRRFFADRKVLEVDTPMLSTAGVTDPNIHSMHLLINGQLRFLHTSPEFAMKRLLAAGVGDIYQICKVFRAAEQGRYHNPEFTLLEWYRLGFDHYRLMREVDCLLHALWSRDTTLPESINVSYADVIKQVCACAIEDLDVSKIRQILIKKGHSPPATMSDALDPWLDLLMTHCVAPEFEKNRFTFLYDYPASQAALAKIRLTPVPVAERFEVYFGELEIANAFHELQDAKEQAQRFSAETKTRSDLSLQKMPVDDRLLTALKSGLPACSGVAIGIDRLLMVLCEVTDIRDVLSFAYDIA